MPLALVSAVTRKEERCTKEITIPYNQNRDLKRHLVFIYNKFVVNRLQLHKWKNKKRGGLQTALEGGTGGGGGPRQ